MPKTLAALEPIARELEPDRAVMEAWLQSAARYSIEFVEQLNARPAFQFEAPNHEAGGSGLEITPHAQSFETLLDVLQTELVDRGLNPASGGHLGYIPGGGIISGALGDFLAAITNQYAGVFFAGPGAVRLENELIRWMCALVGYPDSALGNLTSGGSIANLIAFVTARDLWLKRSASVDRFVIYVTSQVHHCVHKAIRIGGLSQAIVSTIPMDDRYRMDVEMLRLRVEQDVDQGRLPMMVVASAGSTDVGAIDPLAAIADVCRDHEIWMHVDAAYGGFFLLADLANPDGTTVKESLAGIERSDSVAIDPHKGLFLSYGLGAVLIKNVAALRVTHTYQANYMQDTVNAIEEWSPADLSPELSKHFRGLRMWLSLKLFGLRPFQAALEEKILLCRYFHDAVQQLGFRVGPFPQLSVCIFRYVQPGIEPNAWNKRLVDRIQRDGRIFVSSTTIDGEYWIRLAVLCFRTHRREVDLLLSILADILREGLDGHG